MSYFLELNKFIKNYAEVIPEQAIEEAKRRIKEALKEGRIKLREEEGIEKEIETAGFFVEMGLLKRINNSYVKSRVVIAEAKSFYEQRIVNKSIRELMEFAEKVGLKVKKEGNIFMRVEDYLENSPESVDYSLYYKEVDRGWVRISEHELKRIMQERIKNIIERIEVELKESESIKKAEEEIRKEIPKFSRTIKSVDLSKAVHPPCMERVLKRLKNHENLGHYERWTLAIYLIKIGVGIEEINELYKNLPDYKEKITLYQLRHIKEKNYSMASCEKMRGYGLCVAECGVLNPLEVFYGRKGKKMDKKQG